MTIKIAELLALEEGYKAKPYIDTEGYPTIGIGQRIGPKNADIKMYRFYMPKSVSEEWVRCNCQVIEDQLGLLKWYGALNDDRKTIIVSMCYQMGIDGASEFKDMIKAIKRSDFKEAASQMLDSVWARQTPARAQRHAAVMECGELSAIDYYKDL